LAAAQNQLGQLVASGELRGPDAERLQKTLAGGDETHLYWRS